MASRKPVLGTKTPMRFGASTMPELSALKPSANASKSASGSNRLRTSVSLSIKISIGYLLQSADVVVNQLSRSPPNSTRLKSVYTWRQSYNKLTLEQRCHNSKEWEEEPCQIPVSKLIHHQMRGRADLSA